MVKIAQIFILSLCLTCFVFGNSTLEAAKNLLGNEVPESKLRLLLEGKDYEDNRGFIDYARLVQLLKTNSLLNVASANSKDLEFTFIADTSAVLLVRVLNEALKDAGFVHFTPKILDLKSPLKKYTIEVQSRYFFDVGSFYSLLKRNFVFIKNITKTASNSYEFNLDFDDAFLDSNVRVPLEQDVNLNRPLRDYFFSVANARTIKINANSADAWFAKVVFLDKDLRLVEAVYSKEKNNEFKASIPSGSRYVLIGDTFNLDNIRRGLQIRLSR